jgi:hypothetical protein
VVAVLGRKKKKRLTNEHADLSTAVCSRVSTKKEGASSKAWTSNEQPEVCGGISANKDLLK